VLAVPPHATSPEPTTVISKTRKSVRNSRRNVLRCRSRRVKP
jgi:hypothetical protein